ncbi:MAG: hypothetical protein WC842_00815 [Candidatus Paceibacterota bacterium]|jgi:tRNA A-37 threonylcarbamoyl transferase component Bud32
MDRFFHHYFLRKNKREEILENKEILKCDQAILNVDQILKDEQIEFIAEESLSKKITQKVFETLPQKIKTACKKTADENLIERKEVEERRNIKVGSNSPEFIKLKDDGSVVFKSKEGELDNLRTAVKKGTYYRRERASYIVDRFFEFDMVPTTTIKEIKDEIGSAQRFIEDAREFCEIDYESKQKYKSEIAKLFIFDYIIWNSDRHSSNFLVKEDKLYAIDNGLSFGNDRFKPFMIDSPIDFNFKEDFILKINEIAKNDKILDIMRLSLEEHLPEEEINACIWRIKNIAKILNDKRILSKKIEDRSKISGMFIYNYEKN